MGNVGYMFAKKKSMQSLIMSLVRRPGVGASVGLHGGLLTPFNRFATFEERVVCRWVSRNSLITLARDPLGPFFWGMAWYVHDNCADEQLRHGLTPSHLTLRRWQASQALFTDEAEDEDEDMLQATRDVFLMERWGEGREDGERWR